MKIKNLYIGWIYKITSVQADMIVEYTMEGVKLALLRKKKFGRYKDLQTEIVYHKPNLFTKEADLVVSSNNYDRIHFIEKFNNVNGNISKKEALELFEPYQREIHEKVKGKTKC